MDTEVIRLAAFADGEIGGNPAGVLICEKHPTVSDMQDIAAHIGYSETAFAEPSDGGYRVRYFSPESEVPFCGHATIALGAALSKGYGPGVYTLELNEATITVEGFHKEEGYSAALQSPATSARPADAEMLEKALDLFGYSTADLNKALPPVLANGGANHLIITLESRDALSAMQYDLDAGRRFMKGNDLVTVMLVFVEGDQLFSVRNAFASGGVLEDPATGAAAAAFAGFLRDVQWPHGNVIKIVQGEDMGARSLINVELTHVPGSSVRVSGAVRNIQ